MSHPVATRPVPAGPRIDVTHPRMPSGPGLLDLSGAAAPAVPDPPPAPTGQGLLDLSGPRPPVAVPRRAERREAPRVRTGQPPRLLTPAAPTVTLTRLQSGVGQLRVELVASGAVGDVRLGAAVELTDRRSSLVLEGGRFDAWPARRPVVRLVRGDYAALLVDLRQTRELRRLAVLGVSATDAPLSWAGTLVVTTGAGARTDAPLDLGQWQGPVVLATVHVVDGEYVLRAEAAQIPGSVRDLCLAFGYERITWADERTPAA